MADKNREEEFSRLMEDIEQRAAESLPENALVLYSAFGTDKDGLPVDNLDEVAVEGRCIFVQKHDPFFGKGKDYVSGEYHSPTWLQLCAVANDMILITGDQHHVFLEGVNVLREENGIKFVEFEMGS